MATTTKPESRGKRAEGRPRRGAKASRPVPSATSETFELTWPYFMHVIVLCFCVTTIALWVWSMLIPAPLETIAAQYEEIFGSGATVADGVSFQGPFDGRNWAISLSIVDEGQVLVVMVGF